MAALFDLWVIGDGFLSQVISEFHNMQKSYRRWKKPEPYLFQMHNIRAFTPDSAAWRINRFLTALITALNDHHHLPKIILVIPDCDLLSLLPCNNSSSSMFIGASLHYIIKQMDLVIEHRRRDLTDKHPSSLQE